MFTPGTGRDIDSEGEDTAIPISKEWGLEEVELLFNYISVMYDPIDC